MVNRILKGIFREEKGSVMLIMAVGMVVFLGFTAMVIDVGRAESRKFKLSNTMDAAALAGVQDLPASTTAAESAARSIVAVNGFDPAAVDVEFLESNKKIRVKSSDTVDTLFAAVLGITTIDVGAKAAAEVSSLTGAEHIVPVGISQAMADAIDIPNSYGDTYLLKVGPQTNDTLLGNNGWYGALTLNKPGAKTFETNVAEGYDGIIHIDDIIDTETGNMAGPTKDGVTTRLLQCNQGCTYDKDTGLVSPDENCPRIVLVPIYDFLDGQDPVADGYDKQIKQVIITGFASFWLEDTVSEGSGKNEVCTIQGRFIEKVWVGEVGGAGGSDYGAYGARLSE